MWHLWVWWDGRTFSNETCWATTDEQIWKYLQRKRNQGCISTGMPHTTNDRHLKNSRFQQLQVGVLSTMTLNGTQKIYSIYWSTTETKLIIIKYDELRSYKQIDAKLLILIVKFIIISLDRAQAQCLKFSSFDKLCWGHTTSHSTCSDFYWFTRAWLNATHTSCFPWRNVRGLDSDDEMLKTLKIRLVWRFLSESDLTLLVPSFELPDLDQLEGLNQWYFR